MHVCKLSNTITIVTVAMLGKPWGQRVFLYNTTAFCNVHCAHAQQTATVYLSWGNAFYYCKLISV